MSGPNSVVGAGSVVSNDIEPNMVAAGVPAKRICSLDDFLRRSATRDGWIEWGMEKVPKEDKLISRIEKVYSLFRAKAAGEDGK